MAEKYCPGGPVGGGKEPSVELNMRLLHIRHQCNSNESRNGGRRSEVWSIKSRYLHRSVKPAGIPVVSLMQMLHWQYLRLRCTVIHEYI